MGMLFARLAFLLSLPAVAGCVTEAVKFPGTVAQQWRETKMVDQNLFKVSGELQVVASSPESLGRERLRMYEDAFPKVRELIQEHGLPEIIRETHQTLDVPVLELFYYEKSMGYKFDGLKALSGRGPQPVNSDAEAARMKALVELHKSVR